MKFIRFSLLLIVSVLFVGSLHAQIITTDPSFPVASDSVVIFYDATEGTAGLQDFTGDVYAHTGVITENSTSGSDWKYVVADWGENIDKIKMTRVETNLYKLNITPTIRQYYGVPEGERIDQMAFVFRNSDGSKEGKAEGGSDIFVDVFQSTFNVKFIQPTDTLTFQQSPDTLDLVGVGDSDSASIDLSIAVDGSVVKSVTADTIRYQFVPTQRKKYDIALMGTDGNGKDTVHTTLVVNPAVTDSVRPAGLEDGITYIDDNTVRLSLFAPYKDFIYVIGDFNNWDISSDYYMMRDSVNADSVYYWTEISNLTAGEEYGFQYLVDGNLRITDPYVHKVLDGFHDQYISSETYPGLKSYPTGKTNKIVGVLQPGKDAYVWKSNDYKRPDQEKLIVYELLIRDFIEKHDYQTMIDTLDYLERLGVNAIELMPVNEFDGNNSWGYNPTFHLAVDKYYGPADDLKAFIDSCHSRGMAVILDMVLNHAWGPSPLVRLWNEGDYGKPTPENPYLNVEPKHDFNVGYDFNHESAATKYFVDRVNKYWLEEFRFDGFRYDLSKGFTQTNTLGNVSQWGQYDASRVKLLKRMSDTLRKVDSTAYVILEHFAENQEEKELSNYGMMLWGNLNHNYGEAAMGYHENAKSDFSWISYVERGWNDPHVVGYMESHDEERMMYKTMKYGNSSGEYDITLMETALDRVELAATFFLPVPGPKMIWQFGELGYDIPIEYDCRTCPKPLKWHYYQDEDRRDLYSHFRVLNHLRNTYDVFHTSNFSMSVTGEMKKITLQHDSNEVVILGNFGVTENSIDPAFTQTGYWYEAFTLDSMNVEDVNASISLQPGEYRMYSINKFDLSAFIDTTSDDNGDDDPTAIQSIAKGRAVKVFPSPARDVVHFDFETFGHSTAILNIYNLTGQKVATIKKEHLTPGSHEIQWENEPGGETPSVYLYELIIGNKRHTGKFLKY